MKNYDASHIETIFGASGEIYPIDKFIPYPFKKPFVFKNCLVISFSIVMSNHKGLAMFCIDYQKNFTEKTYTGSLDNNGFLCNGVLIIDCSEENGLLIKQDLEKNKSQFFERFSDCE